MARPSPHPLALFSLVPLNKRAEAVPEHPSNRHRVSRLVGNVGLGLDIGHIRSRYGDQATLATLGRDGDVILEGASISKVQCSFEMDLGSTVVMFYDKSRGQTCQVYGEGAFPFAHDRPRRVVVGPKINTIIGIGGLARDLLRFELQWHCEEDEVAASVKKVRETPYLDDDPRFARTIDEADTVPSSRMATRIHTPGPQSLKVKYMEVCRLGRGQFGEVHKGLDIDSGKFIAVKKIPAPITGFHEEWTKLKREIEILSSLSHVSANPGCRISKQSGLTKPGPHRELHLVPGAGWSRSGNHHGTEGWKLGLIDARHALRCPEYSRHCLASHPPGPRLPGRAGYHPPRCKAGEYPLRITTRPFPLFARRFRTQQPPDQLHFAVRLGIIRGAGGARDWRTDTQSRCVVSVHYYTMGIEYTWVQGGLPNLQMLPRCSASCLIGSAASTQYPGNGEGRSSRACFRGTDAGQVLRGTGAHQPQKPCSAPRECRQRG